MTLRSSNKSLIAAGCIALLAAVTVSGCSGSAPATDPSDVTTSPASSSPEGDRNADAEPAADADELATAITGALAEPTSAHLTFAGDGDQSSSSSGQGDIRTSAGGDTEAFTVTVGDGTDSFTVVFADGAGYVKPPTQAQTDPSKPWTKVSSSSTDPAAQTFAQVFTLTQTNTALSQYGDIVSKAKTFTSTGPTQVGDINAQSYKLTVAATDIPSLTSIYGSAAADLANIPLVMAVDQQGRPLRISQTVTLAGQPGSTSTTTFSDYGTSVEISPPPADQTQVS